MPISDLSSLLVLVEPEGPEAQAAFRFSHNEECSHFGKARDALKNVKDATSSKADLNSHIVDPDGLAAVYLALGYDESPKDISKGFIFGSDPETCDVLLAENKNSGVSGNHFSISVDWRTGNPLITCLTPKNGSTGIRIKSGFTFSLFLQDAWKVLDPGETAIIMISETMKIVVHSPGLNARGSRYRNNLEDYFHEYQDAVPEMGHLKLFDSDPTPLLVHRGRGLTGLEYLTTATSVSEKVVSCEAKTRQDWTEPSETYIVKRFRHVTDRWPRRAKTELSRLCELRHRHIIVPEDIITDMTEYMPVYLPEPPETLAARQISAPLTVIDAVEVLAQIFEGLKFLHAHEIVHGSVYPGVIKIKRSCPWSIRLSDIGLHPYVELENQEERELYLSQPHQGNHIPVPVSDTWSSGVVGLALLLPGGLPARSMSQTSNQSFWTRALAKQARAFYETERPGPSREKEAALFLTRVLRYLHSERLTAEECLQDPWIQRRQLSISYDREYSAEPNDQLLGAFDDDESELSSAPDEEAEDEGAQDEGAEDENMTSEEAAYEEAVYKKLVYLEAKDEGPEYGARKPRTRTPKKAKQPRKAYHKSVAPSSSRGPKVDKPTYSISKGKQPDTQHHRRGVSSSSVVPKVDRTISGTLKGKQPHTPHRTSATPSIFRELMADEPSTSTSKGKQPQTPHRTSATPSIFRELMADEPTTSTSKGKQPQTPHRTSAMPMAGEPTTSTSNGKQPDTPYEYQRRGAFSGSGRPKGKWY